MESVSNGFSFRCRLSSICICATISISWFGLVVLIWTLELASDVRLVLVLLATLICLLPITLRVRANAQADIISSAETAPETDEALHTRNDQFLEKLVAGDLSLLHAHPLHVLPSRVAFLAAAKGSKNSPAPPSGFCAWTGQYARRAVQKARVLCLLLQYEHGSIVGFGGGKHGACEVDGAYAALDDRTILISFVVRFNDHFREFRGLAFDSFSLGIRGVWTSKRRRRLGWFRAWPEDSVAPGRIYHMVSDEEGCVVCCRDRVFSPLVALLPCGHVLACRECSDGMASCPACRCPISRVCQPNTISCSRSSTSDIEFSAEQDEHVLVNIEDDPLPSSPT